VVEGERGKGEGVVICGEWVNGLRGGGGGWEKRGGDGRIEGDGK